MDKQTKNPKQNKNPMDIFSDAIRKAEREERLAAFRTMWEMYNDLVESGFTMIEAMTFMAALVKQAQNDNENKDEE